MTSQTRTDLNPPRREMERNCWEGGPRILRCPNFFLPIIAEEGYGKTREDRTKVCRHDGGGAALGMTTFTLLLQRRNEEKTDVFVLHPM
ncbi:hypothetical protein ACOSQ4_026739 [Xanthoceras sorbifolium]